jgi:hypothetical protein
MFPQRKVIIRRPSDGICRFCVKQISASNWSRHIRIKHIEDILKIRQITGEEVGKLNKHLFTFFNYFFSQLHSMPFSSRMMENFQPLLQQ